MLAQRYGLLFVSACSNVGLGIMYFIHKSKIEKAKDTAYNPSHAKAHIDILEKRISQLEEDKNNILIQNKELDNEMEKLIKESQDDTVLNLKLIEELKKSKKKEDALKLDQEAQRKEYEKALNQLKSLTYGSALAAFLNDKLKEKNKKNRNKH